METLTDTNIFSNDREIYFPISANSTTLWIADAQQKMAGFAIDKAIFKITFRDLKHARL